MQLVRYLSSAGTANLAMMTDEQQIKYFASEAKSLHELLRLRVDELHSLLEHTREENIVAMPVADIASFLAPIDGETEVWAAGVTYKRSEEARKEESSTPDIYAKVYSADRPELFFKATARRVAAPNAPVVIRSDSTWDVPEPELVVVVNAYGEIVGYTIGNDVSSRSIEGENPLYLPQAKVYTGSCALGPGITPVWQVGDPTNLIMHMLIERNGERHWEGQTSTSELNRTLTELIEYLFREDTFPDGVLLCTGTALVPELPFTLEAGDVVHISIDQLGTLSNPVVRGKTFFATPIEKLL